jgi:hypothetical protein
MVYKEILIEMICSVFVRTVRRNIET